MRNDRTGWFELCYWHDYCPNIQERRRRRQYCATGSRPSRARGVWEIGSVAASRRSTGAPLLLQYGLLVCRSRFFWLRYRLPRAECRSPRQCSDSGVRFRMY
ncbi:hypothetical protein OH76DRAFT_1190554 [Lentinus brumalis]|uniref:Uncharacterized protein n=1 Tax=Lentinus brumalis TaxID=2498619 RepID=A0A371CTH4_9APHY|nr:hypothetical protein OH76DRAFT_1190554 [Polyporus brumalis]